MIAKIVLKDGRLRPVLRVLVFIVVLFVGIELLEVLLEAIGIQASAPFANPLAIVVIEAGGACTVLLVAVGMRHFVDRRSVASLGFSPRGPWLRLFWIGVALGAGMQALAVGIEAVFGAARFAGYGSLASDVRLVLAAALTFVAAAFSEEMATRGYILQNLWEEAGLWPAVALSSVLFAVMHFGNPHTREHTVLAMVGLIAFALWAAISLLWTGSLWLALGAHAAWNLFEGPVFGMPVSGVVVPSPVISFSVHGPSWLTGTSFGPEAGMSSIAALLCGFGALAWLRARGVFAGTPDVRERYARRSSAATDRG